MDTAPHLRTHAFFALLLAGAFAAAQAETTTAGPHWHLVIAIPGEYKCPAGHIYSTVVPAATFADAAATIHSMELTFTDDLPGGRDYDCQALLHTSSKIDIENNYSGQCGAGQVGNMTPGYPDVMSFFARYDFDNDKFATSTPGSNSFTIKNRKPLVFDAQKTLYARAFFGRGDGHPGPKASHIVIQADVTCAHMPGAVMEENLNQTIQWRPSPAKEAAAQKLHRAAAEKGPFTVLRRFADNMTASFTDTTATPGNTYYYKLIAETAAGVPGAESAVIAVTVLRPTTLACAGSTINYGTPHAVLNAAITTPGETIASGTISFQLKNGDKDLGPAIFSGILAGKSNANYSIPAHTPPGKYQIVAVYNSGGKYGASTDSSKYLTIAPAPLIIAAPNLSRPYGAPNPSLAGEITGLQYGDRVTASYSANATVLSEPGNYTIVPVLLDAGKYISNYALTLNPGVLTVAPSPLSVTAINATRVYGTENPTFTGTVEGLKNGENVAASFVSTATPASPAGNYPVVPMLNDPDKKLSHYAVKLNEGTLVVTPAPLIVSAQNAMRFYGAPNPVFSGTLIGLLHGEKILATYETPAKPSSPLGAYPITPSVLDPDGKLANYSVTLSNGTLEIVKAPLTVTPADATRSAGAPNPAFTGTLAGLQNSERITAQYATAAAESSPPGMYRITVTLSDPDNRLVNYNVTLKTGTLTVTPSTSWLSIAAIAIPILAALIFIGVLLRKKPTQTVSQGTS